MGFIFLHGSFLLFNLCFHVSNTVIFFSNTGMMKSWPAKILWKGTQDQEQDKCPHLVLAKTVKLSKLHGNNIYHCEDNIRHYTSEFS